MASKTGKRYTPEQIVAKLRQHEKLQAKVTRGTGTLCIEADGEAGLIRCLEESRNRVPRYVPNRPDFSDLSRSSVV